MLTDGLARSMGWCQSTPLVIPVFGEMPDAGKSVDGSCWGISTCSGGDRDGCSSCELGMGGFGAWAAPTRTPPAPTKEASIMLKTKTNSRLFFVFIFLLFGSESQWFFVDGSDQIRQTRKLLRRWMENGYQTDPPLLIFRIIIKLLIPCINGCT